MDDFIRNIALMFVFTVLFYVLFLVWLYCSLENTNYFETPVKTTEDILDEEYLKKLYESPDYFL